VVGSGDNVVAVAHNGNIVNSAHLYAELCENGYIFNSSTDSEVIATLISFRSRAGLAGKNSKIRYAMRRIRGAYSLVILKKTSSLQCGTPSVSGHCVWAGSTATG
jgi:amidophosphoribosyltransferase